MLGHYLLRDLVPGNIPSARGHRKGPIEIEASNYFGNFSAQYIGSGLALFYWWGCQPRLSEEAKIVAHSGDKKEYDENLNAFKTFSCLVAQWWANESLSQPQPGVDNTTENSDLLW